MLMAAYDRIRTGSGSDTNHALFGVVVTGVYELFVEFGVAVDEMRWREDGPNGVWDMHGWYL